MCELCEVCEDGGCEEVQELSYHVLSGPIEVVGTPESEASHFGQEPEGVLLQAFGAVILADDFQVESGDELYVGDAIR